MTPRELAERRFLLLIDQVMAANPRLSERGAGIEVGVDPTLPHKVRSGSRGVGPDAWATVAKKIGLRTEWFTDPDLDESDFSRYCGPSTPAAPSLLDDYAARHGISVEAAANRLVGLALAIEKAGGYMPGSVPIASLDDVAPRGIEPGGPLPIVKRHRPRPRRKTTSGL